MPDLTDATIALGRAKKRITKLEKQRDFFRKRCEDYAEVMNLHPHIERRFRSVAEARAERDRVRGLEDRVKEQALLIKTLTAAAAIGGPHA